MGLVSKPQHGSVIVLIPLTGGFSTWNRPGPLYTHGKHCGTAQPRTNGLEMGTINANS